MSVENLISIKSRLLFMIILLHFGASKGGGDGNVTVVSESDSTKNLSTTKISARQFYMNRRDSYLDAANSFGGGGQSHSHAHASASSSYRVPQNSYNAPMQGYGRPQMQQGYGYGGMQQGGWGSDDDDGGSQSSKKDLLGLVGLLGLKGLVGTLPFIKLAILTLIALSPILIPLSIIFKIAVILLAPVLVFTGRSLTEKENNVWKNGKVDKELLWRWGKDFERAVFGREMDNQCMERIACEGLFKSIPRIFFKMVGDRVGDSKPFKKLRTRRDATEQNEGEDEEEASKGLKRKDLATQALKKLTTQQYMTKKPSITDAPESVDKTCRQYKCTVLF